MSRIFDGQSFDFEPFSVPPSSILLTTDRHAAKRDDEWQTFKNRVEHLATQYLNGHTLFVQTASLRGPFDSTWVNPWAPTAAILELRGTESLQLRSERLQRRQKEGAERKKRARALQADGLGKSSGKPVDLTAEADQHKNHQTTAAHASAVHSTAPRHQTDQRNAQGSHKLLDAVATGDSLKTSGDGISKTQSETAVTTVCDGSEAQQNGKPELQTRLDEQSSGRSMGLRKPTPFLSPAIHTPSLRQTPCAPNRSTTDHGHPDAEEKRPCSLPTPSESGNEDESLLQRTGPRARSPAEPASAVAVSGSFRSSNFTTINGGHLERRGDAAAFADPFKAMIAAPPIVAENGDGFVLSRTPHLLTRPATKASKCRECNTQTSKKWYGSGTLCRNCYKNNWNRMKRQMADSRRDSRFQVDARNIIDEPTEHILPRVTRQSARLTLSQPEVRAPDSFETSYSVPTAAGSLPRLSPRQTRVIHNGIYKKMFPAKLLRKEQSNDKHLISLMGPSFRPPWYSLIHARLRKEALPSEMVTSYGSNYEPADHPKKTKTRKRLMTFDTPIIRREVRKKNAIAAKKDDNPVLVKSAAQAATIDGKAAILEARDQSYDNLSREPNILDSVTQATTAILIESGQGAEDEIMRDVEPGQELNTHVNMLSDGTGIFGEQEVAELPLTTPLNRSNVEKSQSHNDTPRTRCHKLLDMHTNTMLSVEEGSRLRFVARLSGGSFDDNQQQSSPCPIMAGTPKESPYVSTQTAMLAAQEAFQEALESPTKELWPNLGSQRADHENENAPFCDITPFGNVTRFREIQEEPTSNEVEPMISTQALFDAFISSQVSAAPQPNPREHTRLLMTPEEIRNPNEAMPVGQWTSKSLNQTTGRSSRLSGPSAKPGDKILRPSLKFRAEDKLSPETENMDSIVEQAGNFLGDWEI